jgi:hypothetical protein
LPAVLKAHRRGRRESKTPPGHVRPARGDYRITTGLRCEWMRNHGKNQRECLGLRKPVRYRKMVSIKDFGRAREVVSQAGRQEFESPRPLLKAPIDANAWAGTSHYRPRAVQISLQASRGQAHRHRSRAASGVLVGESSAPVSLATDRAVHAVVAR